MSKALKKSQAVSMDVFEKKGKKFLKSGWYDYVGFVVFFFGGLYMGFKSLFAGNFFRSLIFFGISLFVIVIVLFGKRIIVKIGELQSKI